MKLLFLDIDGVLTADDTAINEHFLYTFSASCVQNFNEILLVCKPKIILISSWRTVFAPKQQEQIFMDNGVIQFPLGQTKDLGYDSRSAEIKAYLRQRKVESFVILDDMDIQGFTQNFVRTNPSTGITQKEVKKAIEILNKNDR